MPGRALALRTLALGAAVLAAIGTGSVLARPAGAGTVPTLTPSPATVAFPQTRLGHFRAVTITVTNADANPAKLGGVLTASGEFDFLPVPAQLQDGSLDPASCFVISGLSEMGTLVPGNGSCHLAVWFVPTHFGARATTLVVGFSINSVPNTFTVSLSGNGVAGYYGAGAPGWFDTAGWAPQLLSNPADLHPAAPFSAMAGTPTGNGFSLAGADGGVYTFGDARFFGAMGGYPLTKPIVGIAATPTGAGYWEVGADGGIFAFGDARYYGSMGGYPLTSPIRSILASPTGRGYWLAAGDGGIFSFGDVPYYGNFVSTAAGDTVGIAPTASPLSGILLVAPAGVRAAGAGLVARAARGSLTPDTGPLAHP